MLAEGGFDQAALVARLAAGIEVGVALGAVGRGGGEVEQLVLDAVEHPGERCPMRSRASSRQPRRTWADSRG
jgi:hypothetical protein